MGVTKLSFEGPTVQFVRFPVSHLIRPGGITKEFKEKAIQFHVTLHGLKITNYLRSYFIDMSICIPNNKDHEDSRN